MQTCIATKIKDEKCTNPQKFEEYCGIHKSKNMVKVESGGEEFVFFCKIGDENGYMSNWYSTPFEIDEIKYPTVEHYMMYQKALLMKDQETTFWLHLLRLKSKL